MIYTLGILSDIGDGIVQGLRTAGCYLAVGLYSLIEYFYQIFIYISTAQIISDGIVSKIYSKVGLILGMFMVFKLVFSLIQALIEPSQLTEKKGVTTIIRRSIISVVLLGITPSLFKEAMSLQNIIIGGRTSDNVIYKLIVGESAVNINSMGRELASDLYFSFFTDNEDPKYDNGITDQIHDVDSTYSDRFKRDNYDTLKSGVTDGSISFTETVRYAELQDSSGEYLIEYNIWLSIIVGAIVVWMLFMYCVQAGIRVIQLAYLQIIAPIPVLSYISDPDGAFKKWYKQCFTTYIDLFIRLALIYFVISIINDVMNQFFSSASLASAIPGLAQAGVSPFTRTLVKVFIILGLLLFAKKVPDLLKDLFPNFGKNAAGFGFGLGLRKNLLDPLKDVGKTVYNSPIGWGLKGGKALGTYIDRKRHNLPKQRGKFGQAIDKWLPGHAEAHKSRLAIDDRYNLEQEGRKIYEANGGELSTKDFSSSEFRNSWMKVQGAKKELKDAEAYLKYYQQKVDLGEITTEAPEYKAAIKRHKAASSKLEAVKQDHDNIRKIYSRDARKEDAFKYYEDLNGGGSIQSSGGSTMANAQANANTAQRNTNTAPTNTGTWSQGPYVSPQQAEDNAYNEMIDAVNNGSSEEEINSKIDAYNKASQKRQQVDNDIDDFYDRQNDGFGGQ